LFTLSDSKYKDFFSLIFEKVIISNKKISDFSILELFSEIVKEIVDE
jgi:hypothetical protein